jgi:hypothetical protein
VNDVLVAHKVVVQLAKLGDRGDPARLEIQASIARMGIRSPRDPKFPGYLTELGPLTFVMAGGHRIEIEELSVATALLYPGARNGTLYVFGLVSPDGQEEERSSLG